MEVFAGNFQTNASRQLGLRPLRRASFLLTIKHGKSRDPAVPNGPNRGLLFFFNRITGAPIYGVEERKVLSDNPLPGDETGRPNVSRKTAAACEDELSTDEIATVHTRNTAAFCKGVVES